jgi:hypothetical protein
MISMRVWKNGRIIAATTLLLIAGRIPHWLGIEYRLPMAGLGGTSEAEVHP